MAVEPRSRVHAADRAVGIEHDAALGQVEIERTACDAGGQQGAERRIQMRNRGVP